MAFIETVPADEPVRGRPRVLNPGIRMLPPGVERYGVAGGGSVVARVFAGDTIRVVNRQGGQVCEIVAMTADGREEPGILGQTGDGPAEGLRTTLARGGENAEALMAALGAKGLPARFERSVRRFDAGTPAFEEVGFTVERDGVAVVAAPGGDMDVDAHDPPSPLELFIRASIRPSPRSAPSRSRSRSRATNSAFRPARRTPTRCARASSSR